MRYTYTAIYHVLGVLLPPGSDGLELIPPRPSSVSAVLTKSLEPNYHDVDRGLAIADRLLSGGLASEDIDQVIAQRIKETQAERRSRFGEGPFLVLQAEGETPDFPLSTVREFASFVVCVNGAPKAELRERWAHKMDSAITAFGMSLERPITTERIADGFVFFSSGAKPVYSYTFGASVELMVSAPILPDAILTIQRRCDAISREEDLGRVISLLSASMGLSSDKFKAFLTAWSSLEILINKLFTQYNDLLFTDLNTTEQPRARRDYIKRILEVMKDKYRLTDKFAVIASHLARSDADADLVRLKAAKKVRDNLAHGLTVRDNLLPVADVRDLARKYLALHLDSV